MPSSILWTLPVPSTAFLDGGPTFEDRLGREVALRLTYEGDDRDEVARLVFVGVEALRTTYVTACDDSMLVAYDKLVDCGDTDWLAAIRKANTKKKHEIPGLKHLMIYFDDGPCYEAICKSFRVDRG